MTDQSKYELRIDMSIRDVEHGGNLMMSQSIPVTCTSFLEMSAILAEFHKLMQSINGVKKRSLE